MSFSQHIDNKGKNVKQRAYSISQGNTEENLLI